MIVNIKSNVRLFVFSFIILASVLASIIFKSGLFSEEPIYIALVDSTNKEGPQIWEGAEEVSRGIQMYIDSVNKMGGINGKPVKLLIFDDHTDASLAKQVASDIVAQNKAVVVLGHIYSSACIAAGEIYKEAKIPVISPTCEVDAVTEGNKWYFKTISNSTFNGAFLANYIKKVMKPNNISIIYDEQYAPTAKSFQNSFRGLKGKIKHKWVISEQDDIDKQVEAITHTLLRDKPDMVFLAMDDNVIKKIIVSMKRNGLTFPIFAKNLLPNTGLFDEYFEEQLNPSFFSDGIFTDSLLISDVAGEGMQHIRSEYIKKYQKEPSWVMATAYEAAKIAIKAILETGTQGKNRVEERRKIRNYLASRTNMENNLAGIDGHFFFDKHGNAMRPLAIGVFKNRQIISAFTQFSPISNLKFVANLEKELAAGRVVLINGHYMYKTDIVYAGIDFNEVNNIDSKNSTYELDLYIWFRSQIDVDASNIEFINSVRHLFDELQLKQAVVENTLNSLNSLQKTNIVHRVYHIKADFEETFDFRDYPFDKQKLAVRFRHANLTRHNLIYVIDLLGMGKVHEEALVAKYKKNGVFSTISDWKINSASFFQDIVINESTLGSPILFDLDSQIEYSRFNAVIEIKRDILSFVTKNLLPLLFLIAISYAIMFLPFTEISIEAISGTLVAVAFFHLSLANGLPTGIGYAVALDYAFYTIYALIAFQILVLVIGKYDKFKENQVALQRLLLIGKLVYPIVFLIVGAATVYLYGEPFKSPPTIIADSNQNTTDAKDNDKNDKTVLTFGAWRSVEVEKEVNQILAHFTAEHPNIEIKFLPAVIPNYTSMLQRQLEKGLAPDVIQLRPFSYSKPLFEAGYLETLDFPSLKENFDSPMLVPWMSDEGEKYGVPYNAVSHGIYYNMDIFKELNLAVPTTWQELKEAAQTIKKNGYIPFANGLKTGWTTAEFIFMGIAPNFIGGREGRLMYESGQRCFNDKYVVAAFQAIAEIAPFLPESATEAGYEANLFLQSKTAMFIGTSWSISEFEKEQLNFEWSTFAIPAPAGQPKYVTYHPNVAIGLNAASKHKDEAKLFLAWLAKPETGQLFNQKIPGFFPMHKKVSSDNKHAQDFLAISDGIGTDVRWAFPKLMDGIPNGKDLMQKNTEAVIKGEKTPQEAADALQDGLAQWFEPAQICLSNKQ
jgi:branched-chain amino acid transport system substrate-binding protein